MQVFRKFSPSRRRVIESVALTAFGFCFGQGAFGQTNIAALDMPAIKVKNTSNVFLVAMTLAPGGRLVAVGEHGVIVFSDDNGFSWRQASVPVNVTLTCIVFTTARTGWVAGHFGVILKTEDGGINWKMQLNGLQVNQLTMQAALAPSGIAAASPGAALAMRRAKHFMAGGPDNPFLCMLVLGDNKLLVMGAYRMAVLTEDGGKSWCDWSLHIYDKFSHDIYGSLNCNDTYYLTMEEGLIFSSFDQGNKFLPSASPGSSTLFGIFRTERNTLITYGVAGFAARSVDMGKTWMPIDIPVQQDFSYGLQTKDGLIILVNESGLLFKSTDDGLNFTHVENIPVVPFFDLLEADNGDLVAVGATGITNIKKSIVFS